MRSRDVITAINGPVDFIVNWLVRVAKLDAESAAEVKVAALSDLTRAVESVEKTRVLMADDRAVSVYVAGPMTGYEQYNFPAFNAVADNLRKQGYTVYNPADHGLVEGATWQDYLRFDVGNLVKCNHIFLLPGWSQSSGAQLELDLAKKLGIRVSYHLDAERPDDAGPNDIWLL